MKAIVYYEYGGPEVLKLEDRSVPTPGPGQVTVKVAAAGVNFIDIYQRLGWYKAPLPAIPGNEGAGVVEAVGEGVTEVAVGDRVAWLGGASCYAEYALVPADKLAPLPEALSYELGAAAMVQGITAYVLAHAIYPLKPGASCLVHAAAGGVGLLLCQIAKQAGAFVIGTTSTPEKAALARAAGADEVVLYTEQDFLAEVKRITGGRGVNVVYDSVGKDTFDRSLESLAPLGTLVSYGQSSGFPAPLDIQRLGGMRSAFVTRPSVFAYVAERAKYLEYAAAVFDMAVAGTLTLRIGGNYPLADAAEAHIALAGRQTTGKLVLLPWEEQIMRYRTFGKLDWRPSALGFGAMRLPVIDGDPARIDEPEATRMIRHAIDCGVNYVDTAWPYHRSTSELFLGGALRDGYRERVRLATKLPCWLVKEAADFDRFLGEQLLGLQSEQIDFYLLHALDAERWAAMRDLGVLDWAERAMADGRIGYLGFSFHDKYEAFQEIVDAYNGWTFCQIQYNYMDEQEQAGVGGLNYAADKGLAVVVMEPLRGGMLAGDVPDPVQAIWDAAPVQRSAADWALQWLWNQPAVSLVLSGMSTLAQVEQNLVSAQQSAVGVLGADDLALIGRVRDKYRELCPIPCTDCKYCLPCPNEVAIPRIFALYNEAAMYNAAERSRFAYHQWIREEERANCCLQCGECEAKCPQGIKIIDWLEKADVLLGDKAS